MDCGLACPAGFSGPDVVAIGKKRIQALLFFCPLRFRLFLQNCDFMFLATLASSVTMSSALDVELVLLSLQRFSLSVSGIENVLNGNLRI